MDYKEKYKEALERAREIKSKILSSHLSTESCKAVSEYIDEIIPELAESEDERIRKVIYQIALGIRGEVFSAQDEIATKDKVLAWLEKQKVNTEGDFGRGYDCGYECCLHSHGAEWLEKQKEPTTEELYAEQGTTEEEYIANSMKKVRAMREKQKSQDTVGRVSVEIRSNLQTDEVVRKTLIMLVNDGRISVTGAITSSDILNWLEKQKEQKPNPSNSVGLKRDIIEKIVEIIQDYAREHGHIDPETCGTKEPYISYILFLRSLSEQKPVDIELIQRSWYMEGYHDREFGKEPKWILQTGEGGPKHELNPRYGQPLAEQQPTQEQMPVEKQDYSDLNDLERAILRGFLCAGVENVPVGIIKETAKDCLAHLPVEGITQDEIEQAMKTLTDFKVFAAKEAKQYNISHRRDIDWHNFCASLLTYLEANKLVEWSEEDENALKYLHELISFAFTEKFCDAQTASDMRDWVNTRLKSLRPQWKPSEEQMNGLAHAINLDVYDAKRYGLDSLYNDLKKLM